MAASPEPAHDIYKQILADSQPPDLDPAIGEERAAFAARRKKEGGVQASRTAVRF